jgi:formylglycine-generating enzyme required for sulfatase activity
MKDHILLAVATGAARLLKTQNSGQPYSRSRRTPPFRRAALPRWLAALGTIALLAQAASAQTWSGTDDFSSGISTNKWIPFQSWYGQMTITGANGHASFIVTNTTTSEQNAKLIWKGQPTVTNDWQLEIAGHNEANWSTNGSSQLQFGIYNTATLPSQSYGFSMARGRHGSSSPQIRVSSTMGDRTNTTLINTNFAMRLSYASSTKMLEAWYDLDGGGSWVRLDTIDLDAVAPGMASNPANSFTIAVEVDSYYGPITEGQLYVDNFSISNSTPAGLLPAITNQPTGCTNFAGTTANFTVAATGSAPLAYQWRFNGANLANGGSVSGVTTTNLTLANVQLASVGDYSAVVSNASGSVTSVVAVLTVHAGIPLGDDFNASTSDPSKWAPDIHAGPGGQYVQTNGHLQFLGSDAVVRFWIGSFGSYTQDWELILDVNLGDVVLTQDNSTVVVGLELVSLNGPVMPDSEPANNLKLGLGLTRIAGKSYRAFGAWISTNGARASESIAMTANEHGSVRVTFDATSKTFASWYDTSGNTSTHHWTALAVHQINAPPIEWGMTGSSAFGLVLTTYSDGYAVNASDQVYVDNFLVYGSVAGAVTSPPQLQITRSGPQVLLSWLTNWPGFVLETSNNLSAVTVWRAVTNTVTITGNRFWVTNQPASNPAFYRLRQQANSPPPIGMVLIPAGPFTMGNCMAPTEGNGDELPLHTNQISAFYMDQYEVTKALWDKVLVWANTNGYDLGNIGFGKATNHPVHTVGWYDAVKWCNARSEKEGRVPAYYTEAGQSVVYRSGQTNVQNEWVKWNSGYRLPTEAEWEKAARGGTSGQRFPWGGTISWSQANYRAWPLSDGGFTYDANQTGGRHPAFAVGAYPYTSPAGYFAANGYGLYDMAGNLWEWCWDWYGSYPSGSQTDSHGPSSGSYRVHRGGGWDSDAYNCRSARRENDAPDYPSNDFGFRVVLAPDQP